MPNLVYWSSYCRAAQPAAEGSPSLPIGRVKQQDMVANQSQMCMYIKQQVEDKERRVKANMNRFIPNIQTTVTLLEGKSKPEKFTQHRPPWLQ